MSHGAFGLLFSILLIAALLSSSCSRRAEANPAGDGSYSWPSAIKTNRAFLFDGDGLRPLLEGEAKTRSEAPLRNADSGPAAIAVSARRASGFEAPCAVALEGWGVAFLGFSPDATSLRLLPLRMDSLKGLKIGGLWSFEGQWLLPTFRDPFENGPSEARARPSILVLSPAGAKDLALPAIAGKTLAFEPFAFLPKPGSPGSWLAQFRDSSGKKAESLWVEYSGLDSMAPRARAESRQDFETALAPRPLSASPNSLRLALDRLDEGEGTSALLRLDDDEGDSLWYSWGSDPGAARELHAWADGGGRLFALTPEGRAVLVMRDSASEADALTARTFDLLPPEAGAVFTDCALFGAPGDARAGRTPGKGWSIDHLFYVAVWEGSSDAGILVGPALQ